MNQQNLVRANAPALLILTDVILAFAMFTWFTIAGMDTPGVWLGPLLFLICAVSFTVIRARMKTAREDRHQ